MKTTRLLAIVSLLALGLMASKCSEAIEGGPGNLEEYIGKVQTLAVSICGFEPTASTIANIVGTATGAGAAVIAATTVAHGICDAVVPSTDSMSALVGKVPTYEYRGVKIEGKFVDKK